MKNIFNVPSVRLFGVIALAAIIGFSMAACKDEEDEIFLTAPTGFTATAYTPTDIIVTWNAVAGASGYNVYASLYSSSGFQLLGSTQKTAENCYNASPNTTYYFKVAAYNANGEGPMSNVVYATTSGYYSLDGVWEHTRSTGDIATGVTPGTQSTQITVSGSTGRLTRRSFSPVEQDAINKGYYNINSIMWRNLTSNGNLNWSGEEFYILVRANAPNVVSATVWVNCTITMNPDGRTITLAGSWSYEGSSGSYNETWTRK
jgi:hypothetical protein